MPRRKESIFEDAFNLLKDTPIWFGPILALFMFVLFRSLYL